MLPGWTKGGRNICPKPLLRWIWRVGSWISCPQSLTAWWELSLSKRDRKSQGFWGCWRGRSLHEAGWWNSWCAPLLLPLWSGSIESSRRAWWTWSIPSAVHPSWLVVPRLSRFQCAGGCPWLPRDACCRAACWCRPLCEEWCFPTRRIDSSNSIIIASTTTLPYSNLFFCAKTPIMLSCHNFILIFLANSGTLMSSKEW